MIVLHAVIIFAGYAAFFIALLSGIAFLNGEGKLKRKDPRVLRVSAIPLELLDRINWWAVLIGFGLFSLGVVHGLVLAKVEWGSFWSWDAKEIWSVVTLAAYALVLGLRLTVGLRGHRVVVMSVMSFVLVMFTFVGVNYFIGSRHVFF